MWFNKHKNICFSIGLYIVSILATSLLLCNISETSFSIRISDIIYITLVVLNVLSSAFGIFFAAKAIRFNESKWTSITLICVGVLLLAAGLFFVWLTYIFSVIGKAMD